MIKYILVFCYETPSKDETKRFLGVSTTLEKLTMIEKKESEKTRCSKKTCSEKKWKKLEDLNNCP